MCPASSQALGGEVEALWRDIDAGAIEDRVATDPAWGWTLGCARWAGGIAAAPGAPPADGDPRALARGAWILSRGALAAHDRRLLAGWVDFAERQGSEPTIVALLRAFRAYADGDVPAALQWAADASERAVEEGASAVRVEAQALLALALLEADRPVEAREVARRASRMGRTESLPQSEYLAGLALARVRRWEGRPHHAARILTALAAIAPDPWRTWAAAELWLCGDGAAAVAVGTDRRAPIGATLAHWLAGTTPERPSYRPLERIASEVDALLDPDAPAPDVVERWRHGGPLPERHRGLLLVGGDETSVGAPWIRLVPGRPAKRLLALGLARLDLPRLRATAKQRRTSEALAVLALAGEAGLAREAFFERVYGFAFKAVTHQGSLDVLLHRVRELIGEHGTLDRSEGGVALTVQHPCVVEGPPDETPLEQLVLRTIATHPGHGARELAKELGVALRTMQTLLGQLADEGLCDAAKDGRRLVYRVEDTTFSEPTRAAVPPTR